MTGATLPSAGIVRAIALDANVMHRGRLSLDVLQEILEVVEEQELQAEVWIPEPVLWEWAEHAWTDLAAHAEKHNALRESLVVAGLDDWIPPLPDGADVEAILASVENTLAGLEQVRVLRLRDAPGAAHGGLRDQVLQVGAGRTKSASSKSVKTGAADGTSFRLIESAAGGNLSDVVLVSGDGDALRYFAEQDRPSVFRSWADLRGELINLRPRDEVATENFIALAREILVSGDHGTVASRALAARHDTIRTFLGSERYLETTMSIDSVRTVDEVRDVEISEDGSFATALVVGSVDVELTGLQWNDVDDVLDRDVEFVHDVAAELNIEARLADGEWSFSVVDGDLIEPSP